MKKYLLFVISIIIIGLIAFETYLHVGFSWAIQKEQSKRMEQIDTLKGNYLSHKIDFYLLVTRLETMLYQKKFKSFLFHRHSDSLVSIMAVSNDNFKIQGLNLLMESPELDSTLVKLAIDKNDVVFLNNKLLSIGHDYIKLLEIYNRPIQIFDAYEKEIKFSFYIYPNCINDSLYQKLGVPLEREGFGCRVVLK